MSAPDALATLAGADWSGRPRRRRRPRWHLGRGRSPPGWAGGSGGGVRRVAGRGRRASRGRRWEGFGRRRRRRRHATGERPTGRELEVVALIARGQSNKLIARALDLSPHTVKRHVANALGKLGMVSRGQAAAWFHARLR
ncbi:MAG: helix-turn-helix transcriptional regulator [Rubrivivax sp.]|nr:helix-turn-helix transcriptional regulator [Rubrivivax sp.]